MRLLDRLESWVLVSFNLCWTDSRLFRLLAATAQLAL